MRVKQILLVGSMGLVLTGCWRVNEDMSQDPTYAPMIGREFRTKVEMAVFRFRDSRGVSIDKINWEFPSREKIKPPFPIKYQSKIIFGILPEESEFQVVKVKREGSTGMNFIHYVAKITKTSDPQWEGKIVYTSGLATVEIIPKFKPEYVEELTEP